MVQAVKRLDHRTSTRFFPSIEILAKEQYHQDQDVFFSVCCREGMKLDRHYVQYVTALWAGLDFSADGFSGKSNYFSSKAHAAKAIRSFPLPPSIIVESGWGVHLYWLLHQMATVSDVARIEQILTKINSYFLCTNPIKIDSMLRLPGTFNCKMPGEVTTCYAKYVNVDFRYTLEEFEKLRVSADGVVSRSGPLIRTPSKVVPIHEAGNVATTTAQFRVDAEGEAGGQAFQDSPSHTLTPGRSSSANASSVTQSIRGYANASLPEEIGNVTKMTDTEIIETVQTDIVEVEELSDTLADDIVNRVVEGLSGKLMDQLADKIVAKLYEKLTNSPK